MKKIVSFTLLLFPTTVFAENKLPSPTSDTNIQQFIVHVLQGLVQLSIPVIAVAIVFSGFKYIMARGNPAKIKEAHNNFLYVLIGSALLLGAWALVTILGNTVSQIISSCKRRRSVFYFCSLVRPRSHLPCRKVFRSLQTLLSSC